MRDVFGNELKVGDKVVYIANATSNSRLNTGVIEKIYADGKQCTVNGHSHIFSYRVMKL